ncbi:MAG TPA: ATP-binding cassette domain-containing protein [Nitrospiria bacterium]|nr:ATP-binding cassette domain-containing protein [Nitrospiria bacterium]
MIEADLLTKRYGSLTAIEQVTFRVEDGEVLAFLGPNGAGKTTTMRILTGSLPATSGRVRVAGYDIDESPLEVKRRIGYLPETLPLYPEMTVTEYLRYVARIKGVSRSGLRQAVGQALERCALGQVRGRLIGNLSRGYRQRVGLAQALIHDPPVLVLDEPTGGLDPKQIIEIRELIKTLAGAHTVILSTHILPEATAICQRVIIIHKGRVVAVDTPERLAAQLRGAEQVKVALRRPTDAVRHALATLPGVLKVTPQETVTAHGEGAAVWLIDCERGQDVREAVASLVVNANGGLVELSAVAMSLEEVFLQLTTDASDRAGAPAPDGHPASSLALPSEPPVEPRSSGAGMTDAGGAA